MYRSALVLLLCALSAFPESLAGRERSVPRTEKAERQWAQKTLRSLSLRDLTAQLVIVPFYGDYPNSQTTEFRQFQYYVKDLKVGGLIVLNRPVHGVLRNAEPYAMAAFLNRMQKLAKLPLLVAGDFERGSSMRVASTTKYPHNMAFAAARDLALSSYEGAATARESRALGVHWILAPDADVNNNPDNPIINIRSYSENPEEVSAHVKAYIEGAQSDPKQRVLTTVKHFPGHGDTTVDSHVGLGTVSGDRARLDAIELAPFRAAIAAGVDAVMTAHLTVPAIEPAEVPATVSAAVLTQLLRNELHFEGIIVTDAMDMQGLSKQFPPGEAAIKALEAGADVLLIPPKPDEAVQAVMAAVKSGRLTRRRLEVSVSKLLHAKARLGLHKNRLVDLEAINDNIDSPEASDRAQEVADRAVTLVKNEGQILPLSKPETACVVILTEGRYSQQGRILREEISKHNSGAKVFLTDPSISQVESEQILQKMSGCETNVLAAFVTVGAYRGDVALNGGLPALVAELLKLNAKTAMISLGNPYLLRSFPTINAYAATFSTAPTSETAAAKALFGEIGFAGHLPVTIPGQAKYGEGIMMPKSDKAPTAVPHIVGIGAS